MKKTKKFLATLLMLSIIISMSHFFSVPINAATPSITLSSSTTSSLSFNVVYPSSGAYGNRIELYDTVEKKWLQPSENALYINENQVWLEPTINDMYVTDGTYTFNGLIFGRQYMCRLSYLSGGSRVDKDRYAYTRNANYSLSEYKLESDHFIFDESLHGYLTTNISPQYFNLFLERMDLGYEAMLDLLGRAPSGGAKIMIRGVDWEGLQWGKVDGNIIFWSYDATFRILNSIHKNKANDWWFSGTMHELGHNFSTSEWNYQVEQMASFQAWLAIEKCGGYFEGVSPAQFMRDRLNQNPKGDDIIDYVYPILIDTNAWEIFQKVFRSYYDGSYERTQYNARTDYLAPDGKFYINEKQGDTYTSETLSILIDLVERCSFFMGKDIKDYWTPTTIKNFSNIKIYNEKITLNKPIFSGTATINAVVTGLDPSFDDYWIRLWKNGVQISQYRSPANQVNWTLNTSISNLVAGDVIKVTLHAGYWELTETGFISDQATAIPASENTKITLDKPVYSGTSNVRAVVTGLDPSFDDYWIRLWKNGVEISANRSPANQVNWTLNTGPLNLVAGDVIKVTLHAGYWELTETGFTSDSVTVNFRILE